MNSVNITFCKLHVATCTILMQEICAYSHDCYQKSSCDCTTSGWSMSSSRWAESSVSIRLVVRIVCDVGGAADEGRGFP